MKSGKALKVLLVNGSPRNDGNTFCCLKEIEAQLQKLGVQTVICPDISRDGAMRGANRELYRDLSEAFQMQIVASGGVSDMEDVIALRKLDLYGAIIGKAYYTGAIDLRAALEAAK